MISVAKGSILIYRVFDIASEIDLARVSQLVEDRKSHERLTLKRGPRPQIVMRNAPVVLTLGESEINLQGRATKVETLAKFWDYGCLSVSFSVPIQPGTAWKQLVEMGAFLEADAEIDALAKRRAMELIQVLSPALTQPQLWDVFEDYVIFFFEKIEGLPKAVELKDKVDVSSLILGEGALSLSKKSRDVILESSFQYSEDDLAIVDWNSAIVIEPNGRKEVPDVLEFALTHLMEMRFYDDLLDDRLEVLYDAVEKTRGAFFRSRFSALSRDASMKYIEFSEFIERVDNSIKVVGDFYLATIFRAAGEKFRILDWENSITRKMNMLARVSELLQGEVHAERSLVLEMIIVFLISFEVLAALLKWWQ